MDKISKLVLIVLLGSPFVVNAVESSIKVGDSFKELRSKYGMPENVNFLSNSKGEKFETVSFKSHQNVYVFDALVGSSMDLQAKPDFKICRIVNNPEPNVGYTCELN